jgi:hypothetical protein
MKAKQFKLWLIVINIIIIIICFTSFYLYSSLIDFFSWGSSNHSGLHFLLFPYFIFPFTILLAAIKAIISIKANRINLLLSSFIPILIVLPALIDTNLDKFTLWSGVTLTVFVIIIYLFETIFSYRAKY